MDKKQIEIELKKIEVEKLKFYEGILRTLFLVLIADIGGVLTLILRFENYNQAISLTLISLSTFIGLGFVFAIGTIISEIKRVKNKLED